MTRFVTLMLVVAMVLCAANAPTLYGLTSKQVVFKYSRPDTATCTWEVSISNTYNPLVADVQGGGGTDAGTQGSRWFIVGSGTPLAASTAHYWRQTCGTEVYTGQFTTLDPVTEGTTNWVFSTGEAPNANKLRLEYGPTPALGYSVETACTPRCLVELTPQKDSLLFYQMKHLNETDVLSTGPVQLWVFR